jgi:hypothetical protein
MDADVLVTIVNAESKLDVTKATLVSSLARYVKAGDTFTRPRPGVYGLKEFQPQKGLLESA